jgi:hypothetical protein
VSKATKLPALQFYPGDWKKDMGVQALELADRGLWFEMLLLMHDSDDRGKLVLNGRPMPNAAIARAIGISVELFEIRLTLLLELGVASIEPDTGVVYCRRMVKDEKSRLAHKEAGKKGGNPRLVNQTRNQNGNQTGTQKPTPSLSSSVTEISDDKINASMAVSGLIDMTGLHSRDARVVLESMAMEIEKRGGDLADWANTLARSWQEFEKARPRLEYHWSAAKFFGEGHYKNPNGWPWKPDQGPKKRLRPVNE